MELLANCSFQSGPFAKTGVEPNWLTVGDFDGDGGPDLASANRSTDNVTVLLGNGTGSLNIFGLRETVGELPASITHGDFNRDGIADLVVGNRSSDDVSILLGIGDGLFSDQQRFSAGEGTRSVVAGDFNQDQLLDIATCNFTSDDVSILLGDGFGAFATQLNFGVGQLPYSLAIGDVNGDGKIDLTTANQVSDDVSVLLGNGDGTFQEEQRYSAGIGPFSTTISDLNQDGKLDVAIANGGSNNISVLLGRGDGTFLEQQFFEVGSTPISIESVDVNRDQFIDLVTANLDSDDVSVLLGTGNGGFLAQQRIATGDGPISVIWSEINGDGLADLITSNAYSDDVSVLIGDGQGFFVEQQRFRTGEGPFSVTASDFNNDGQADLATANINVNDVSVLLNRPVSSLGGEIVLNESFFAADMPSSLEYQLGIGLVGQSTTVFPFVGNWDIQTGSNSLKVVDKSLRYPGVCAFGGRARNEFEPEGAVIRNLETRPIVGDQLGFRVLHRRDGTVDGAEIAAARIRFDSGTELNVRSFNAAGLGFEVNGLFTNIEAPVGQVNFLYSLVTDEGGLNGSDLLEFFVNPPNTSSIDEMRQSAMAFGRYFVIEDQEIWDSGDSITDLLIGSNSGDGVLGADSLDEILVESFVIGVVLGDVNMDGLINLLDIEPFVTLLSNGQFLAEADINKDGVVNLLDIEGFVALLSGG